jgi:hypothetical protein
MLLSYSNGERTQNRLQFTQQNTTVIKRNSLLNLDYFMIIPAK